MTQIGRPREFDEERVTKALRISKALDDRLKFVARERGVSVNVLMNTALEDFLDRLLPLEDILKTAS
jgi:predicted HicB family RNase H-like nuclease